jgi:diamine N-acetyltransferase
MTSILIRKATIADLHKLQQISAQTFSETFSAENSDEDMKKYLEDNFNDEQLSKELNNPDSEFYLAAIGLKVVAYLKLNYRHAQTEVKDLNALEIERIYVLKDFQSKKIGRHLFEKALSLANQQHLEYIWLGVWEHNYKALNFYLKIGFTEFGKHLFRLGNDVQTDLMMKLNINQTQ